MTATHYTPLPTSVPWSVQASGAQWWRRRALRATYLVVTLISVLSLVRYTFYLLPNSQDESSDFDEDYFDPSLDAAYIPFKPSRKPIQTSPISLKPANDLPSSCLDAHIADGQLCYSAAEPRLDIVWTWVNGSDSLLQDALERVENSLPADSPYRPTTSTKKVRQFRDHDELRFSMRSALQYFKQSVGAFRLISTDFGIHSDDPNITALTQDIRLGQIPQWLDTHQQAWMDDNVKLTTIHHANIFDSYNESVFNSYAIESQFGHLEGVSENFVYMNDDFFFLNDIAQKSFYTSPYGLVFRMQSDLMVSPTMNAKYPPTGEWLSLGVSNKLLGDRFGSRHRPYVTHEAKSASVSMLHEMSQIWTAEVANAASHPFRETRAGAGDLSMMFMMVHFVIERWREALLWTWVVGKHGRLDDSWGETEMANAWRELGGMDDRAETLIVQAGRRSTLEADRVSKNLKQAGLDRKDPTSYAFSSQDGFPYTNFKDSNKNKWPKFGSTISDHWLLKCPIDPKVCFADQDGNPFTRASDVFTNVAFRHHQCGDCIITAMVKASGELGLSAFLPPSSRSLASLAGKVSTTAANVPHLPLVSKWEDGHFSLRDVMGAAPQSNVRDWALQLLQRYRFVIGDTPSQFSMIKTMSDVRFLTRKMKMERWTTLLCVNDDIKRDEELVSEKLHEWFEEQWPTPAAWEQ